MVRAISNTSDSRLPEKVLEEVMKVVEAVENSKFMSEMYRFLDRRW